MSDLFSLCCSTSGQTESRGCVGHRYHAKAIAEVGTAPKHLRDELLAALVRVPGGFFDYGARRVTFATDLDAPRLRVRVDPFLVSPIAVTNCQFRRFVDSTSYVTVAEREGWSFVFHLLLADPTIWPQSPPGLPWWRKVDGASWHRPEGPGSAITGRVDHPVVHIAWYDALAYCRWAGLRLLSEVEWERAARGGLARMKFPWGNAMRPGGAFAMNTWQGDFPHANLAEDGFIGTAPADAFKQNAYGLYNTTGNVWEWVRDAFGPRDGVQHRASLELEEIASGAPRVHRGGSYLCHVSYCDRYHVHSRSRNDPDSSTGNCGFRVGAFPA
jgi:sulfatase modifying factor 1